MLPDYRQRNELKFYVAGIPYNVRFWLVLGLWLFGLLIQAATGWLAAGAVVIFLGTILALTRGYSNEPPRTLRGQRRWENVTLDQFERVATLDREGRRWDRSAPIDATNILGLLFGLVLALTIAMAAANLRQVSFQLASVCLMDSVALFAPFWITGIRRLYHRTELMIRVGALQNILDRLSTPDMGGWTAAPMLELEKTESGDVPQDAKLLARFDGAPENFIGIQVQVSLNNVQGTKYPYLYCVILAKPGFGLQKWNIELERIALKIAREYHSADEVELIVVRQQTTKKSGYHTNRAAQILVLDAAAEICSHNLSRQS